MEKCHKRITQFVCIVNKANLNEKKTKKAVQDMVVFNASSFDQCLLVVRSSSLPHQSECRECCGEEEEEEAELRQQRASIRAHRCG